MVSEVPAEGTSPEVSPRSQRSRSLLLALVVSVLALPLVLVDLLPASGEDEESTAVIAPLAAYDAVTVTERESTTTTEAPTTTAAPTTTTAAPTTTTTAAPTTSTTAKATTSTTAKASADTYAAAAPPTTAAPAPTTTQAPVVTSPPSTDIGAFLACVRQRESGGYYGAVNNAGYYGAYQFHISTWDNTARHAGRPDLVGVRPDKASPADQDAMAIALYRWQGAAPWGGYCV